MNKSIKQYTTHKIIDPSPNEDAIIATDKLVAISDGAGGCGIFAKEWATYLVEKIPNLPFVDFDNFTMWTDSIWEEFYNNIIADIGKYGTIVENKFNNEGSYATLAVIWYQNNDIHWCCYGDSGIFIFNKDSNKMKFMSEYDIFTYDNNPSLINWKDIPKQNAFKQGSITIEESDIVIVASDAISCFITIAYYVYNDNEVIEKYRKSNGKLDTIISNICYNFNKTPTDSFYKDVIEKFISIENELQFRTIVSELYDKKCIANDDYSLILMNNLEYPS